MQLFSQAVVCALYYVINIIIFYRSSTEKACVHPAFLLGRLLKNIHFPLLNCFPTAALCLMIVVYCFNCFCCIKPRQSLKLKLDTQRNTFFFF